MKRFDRVGGLLLRSRYVVLVLWAAPWFVLAYVTRPRGLTDWLTFEFGARTLIHLNSHYNTGALGLYAHYPFMQIGPPPLVIIAAMQWLRPLTTELILACAMGLAGVWCLRCAELVVERHMGDERRRGLQTVVLRAGLVLLPTWAWEAARWQHLDDVIAITAIMTAVAIIAGGNRWWLAGVLVGLAIASKPWALVATPCLLGLPRQDRARATLLMLATAAACWGPFVLAYPQTVSALGGFPFTVDGASTMHFLGLPLGVAPKWIRPAQFIGGIFITMGAVRQRRWAAIPFLGFAFRVVIDPQMWLYYGMGPLVAAALWDAAEGRRWPIWTGATAVVMFAVPTVEPSWSGPVRLVWFIAVVVSVLRPNPEPEQYAAVEPTAAQAAAPVPALV